MSLHKILILLIISFSSCAADSTSYKVERLSLEKGISHNTVFCITQDSEKYLWFGTMFGLIRYDGREYVKYRTDPFNYNTLSDDDIVSVYEASDGRLWIGTYGGGVNVFNKDSLKFKRFNRENLPLKEWSGMVWDIIEDSENNIWITTGNQGIIKIPGNDESIEHLRNSDSSNYLSSNYLQTITKNNSGIWFGGYGGLTYYDQNSKKFNSYSDENIKGAFIKDIQFLDEDLLLCASDKGLYSYTLSGNKFSNLSVFPEKGDNSVDVNRILLTDAGQIWLGTQDGIYICDGEINLISRISEENGLYNNSLVSLHEDHSGIIWAGSYMGGVSKILKTDSRFTLINHHTGKSGSITEGIVKDFAVDSKNNIWVCTAEGITKLNGELKVTNSYPSEYIKTMLQFDIRCLSIEIDSNDNIYVGTNLGVVKVSHEFRLLERYTRSKNGISSDVVTKLLIDSDNNLWAGTLFGVSKINLQNGNVDNWNPDSESNKLIGQNVLSLFEDSKGIIWTGTYRGLNKINPETTEVEFKEPAFNDSSTISNKYLYDFLEFDTNKVWIATGNGIDIFDRETGRFDLLNRKEGIANGVIKSFLKYNDKVYIGTNYGISIFDLSKGTIQNYDGSYGLGNNIFSAGASVLTHDNKILFGGLNGISVLDPVNFKKNNNIPVNIITSIRIFDNEVIPSDNSQKLKLEYDQNSITFKFAGLEFTNPEKNQFSYKLEGIDEAWKFTNDNSITYHHLPHDEYKFLVKAANSDGLWNDEAAAIPFIINPPFWKTYWFYTLIIVPVIGSALFLHYKRLQSKLKIFLKIEEAKQQENEIVRKRAAEDFHDELGHHLTRITLLIELLKRKFSGAEIKEKEDIKRLGVLAKELSNKMRDFIWSLDSKNDTLYDLVIRLKDFGDDLFYDTSVSFKLSGVNDELKNIKLTLDWRRHLTLIFKEAMNNIVKYSNCGNVELKIERQNQKIKIELLDDGKGFDMLKIKTGNGLRNMKTRADYLKAKIAINSRLDNGTQIILEGMIS